MRILDCGISSLLASSKDEDVEVVVNGCGGDVQRDDGAKDVERGRPRAQSIPGKISTDMCVSHDLTRRW